MKRLFALVGVVSAFMLSAAAASQAAVDVNTSIPITLVEFVPCANGGAGEVIVLSGELHILITTTINDNNVSGKDHFQPQDLSGVGLTSGDEYQGTGVTQDTFKFPLNPDGSATTQTFVNNFRMIGQGPGNNLLVHETFHIIVNANGDLSVVHDNFSFDCK